MTPMTATMTRNSVALSAGCSIEVLRSGGSGEFSGFLEIDLHEPRHAGFAHGNAAALARGFSGFGAALIFLPLAGRLRERAHATSRQRDLIAEALFAIHERMNPRLVAQKLKALSA